MVNTIRIDHGNFKSLQNKLPKCNYNKENEGNVNKVTENTSCVLKNSKVGQNDKLPQIKRPESACKKEEKLVNRI